MEKKSGNMSDRNTILKNMEGTNVTTSEVNDEKFITSQIFMMKSSVVDSD